MKLTKIMVLMRITATMPNLPTAIAQSIASLGLALPQAARKIGGDMAGYKAANKRLTKYTSKTPPSTSGVFLRPLPLG